MRCPFCLHIDTQVKDSRSAEEGATIRRRRLCSKCHARFTTFERVHLREMYVTKRDGRREIYDREKLGSALKTALRKRNVPADDVERLTSSITRALETSGENEIPSQRIGEMAMEKLSSLDQVGYVRFASVYRDFQKVSDFAAFISQNKEGDKEEASASSESFDSSEERSV